MRQILAAALLFVLTWIVYGQVAGHEFLNYDDDVYVTANPDVQGGVTAESLAWALRTSHSGNWHPLTWVSHMLDCSWFGLEPRGHHLVSAGLHALAVLLLLAALLSMRCAFRPAAFVAAMFAVHPLRVESVAWVAERKDVLSGVFFMTTLLAWSLFARRPGVLRYALVAVSLALGLLAKPMLVTVPCLLLLLDVWPLRRWRRLSPGSDASATSDDTEAEQRPVFPRRGAAALVLEKLPLLALSAVSSWMTFAHQRETGAVLPEEVVSYATRLSNAGLSIFRYVADTLAPTALACFYPHPALVVEGYTPWTPGAILALVAAVVLTLGAVALLRRAPELAVGWWWTVGMLVPVLGLLQVGEQSHADRYAYLPLLGLTLGVAAWSWRVASASRAGAATWTLVAVLAVLACTLQARRQAAVWHDSVTLFEHALEVTDGNYIAHFNIGSIRAGEGRMDEAEERFLETIRINPRYANGYYNLGVVELRRGNRAAAIERFEECLALSPHQPDVQLLVARLLVQEEEHARAAVWMKRAAPFVPRDAAFLRELADTLAKGGDLDGARRAYESLASALPDDAGVLAGLGGVLLRQGDLDAAESVLRRANAAAPGHPEANANLGVLFQRRGDARAAIEHLRVATRSPTPPLPATNLLARMLATSEDPDLRDGVEALRLARLCAARSGSRNALYLDTQAAALAELGRFEDAVRLQEQALRHVAPEGSAEFRARLALYRSGKPYREPLVPR